MKNRMTECYGVEQRKEELSLQELTACQGHPMQVNSMAESCVVTPCGHMFIVVLFMSSASDIFIAGMFWSNAEKYITAGIWSPL